MIPSLPDDGLLVFLHMPKTGGRSVTRLLDRTFGDQLFPHKVWPDIIANQADLARHRAVRGHIFASILDFVGERAIGAAFFRDPVERAVSEYRFICRNEDHGRHHVVRQQCLLDFVTQPNNLKVYCRFLGFAPEGGDLLRMRQLVPDDELLEACKRRIDRLGFVGITEHFDDHFRRLEGWLGVEPDQPIPRVNTDPNPRPPAPADVADAVRETGWIDMAIYEYAKAAADA